MALKHAIPVFLVVVLASPFASAQEPPTGLWMPKTTGGDYSLGACATDGTYLYLIGGSQQVFNYGGNFLTRYDPATDSWASMANMPGTCQLNSGAFYGGRIFSFGNETPPVSGAIYAYTIATNTWATLTAALRDGRTRTAAARLGDKIYITGGYVTPTGAYSALTDEFDPSTDTITARASMPAATGYHAMAAVEAYNRAYVMGGYDAAEPNPFLSVCYEYAPPDADHPDGVWTGRASLIDDEGPRGGQLGAAFVLNDRVYFTGGRMDLLATGITQHTLEYAPNADLWFRRCDMGTWRYAHAATAIAGKGYVYGKGLDNTGEEFTPPEVGVAPLPPSNVRQSGTTAETPLQAQSDPALPDGWTEHRIIFSAEVTDPDQWRRVPQKVRLLVRVKRTTAALWTVLDSGFQDQGGLSIEWTPPTDGPYDWEYAVEDSFYNRYPPGLQQWEKAFGNSNSPDFRSGPLEGDPKEKRCQMGATSGTRIPLAVALIIISVMGLMTVARSRFEIR